MNDSYKIHVASTKRTCEVTFFFDDGATYTLPTRYYPGIEDDIRRNYYAWRAHAVAYCAERAKLDNILDVLTVNCLEDESKAKIRRLSLRFCVYRAGMHGNTSEESRSGAPGLCRCNL